MVSSSETPIINALLVKWMREWEHECRSRNLKTQYAYRKAIGSLSKHGSLIVSGKDATRLDGIGQAIAQKIDLRIEEYKSTHNGVFPAPEDMPTIANSEINSITIVTNVSSALNENAPVVKKRKKSTKSYVPLFRSGGYAILLALHVYSNSALYGGCMSRSELIDKSQPFCDSPMEGNHEPGKYFCGWTSVKTLLSKSLVVMDGRPTKYSLTDDGRFLAQQLYDVACTKDSAIQRLSLPQIRSPLRGNSPKNLLARIEKALFRNDHLSPMSPSKIRSDSNNSENVTASLISLSSPQRNTSTDCFFPSMADDHMMVKPRQSYRSDNACIPGWNTVQLDEFIHEQLNQPCYHVLDSPIEDFSIYNEISKHTFVLKSGTFDIILVIDNREVRFKADRTFIQEKLFEKGIRCVNRSMELGDFVWIAKPKKSGAGDNDPYAADRHDDEVVLDYIIERKRMDDLQSSIIDGRFKEQKFRLRHCGANSVTYLVEDYASTEQSAIDPSVIRLALARTQIVDDFFVKRTKSIEDTLSFLAMMTNSIQDMYLKEDLVVLKERALFNYTGTMKALRQHLYQLIHKKVYLPYGVFQEMSSKSKLLTAKDVFIRQLIQIRGVSSERAKAIAQRFPSFKHLYEAYQNTHDNRKREIFLADIPVGKSEKHIGFSLSKFISELFCNEQYTD